ncbi:MAG: metallophosphoesterase [Alphaproteobacteria bacterium]
MRLALIADLHFGDVAEGIAELLAASLRAAAPDLVLVAGDLTMRARRHEFAAYLDWESGLGLPTLVVPGNHDIAVKPLERFRDPFGRFRRALDRPVEPELCQDGLYVAGFNTVAAWQPHLDWQEGRARRHVLARAGRRLQDAAPDTVRMLLAHHPFEAVPDQPRARPVLRARAALDLFARHRVGVVMSGHTHRSFRRRLSHRDATIVSLGAPTAMSNRQRGEANGFWLLDLERRRLRTQLMLRGDADAGFGAAGDAETVDLPA